MQHCIGLPYLLQVGVVGGKPVVGAGTAGVEQPHGVAFVAKGGLDAYKHIAEVAPIDQQVGAVGVEVAGGLAPVLLEPFGIGGEPLVLLHAHAVGNGELRGAGEGFRIAQHGFHQGLRRAGHVVDGIALGLHFFEHPVDRAEDIEVGRGAHVALVGGEAEHGDGQLFLGPGLGAQGSPANRPFGDRIHPVLEGVGLAGGVVSAGKHDGFNGAIQLGDGDLQGDLHGVEAQIALLPFLGGLKHQGQGHHVGAVQALQHLDGLGMVLAGGASDQGKTREAHHGINDGLVGVEGVLEEGIHRLGEVEAATEDGNHGGTAILELLNHRHVVGFIAGDDVAALQHQADHRTLACLIGELAAARGPIEVFLEVFEHPRGHGVPDAEV